MGQYFILIEALALEQLGVKKDVSNIREEKEAALRRQVCARVCSSLMLLFPYFAPPSALPLPCSSLVLGREGGGAAAAGV